MKREVDRRVEFKMQGSSVKTEDVPGLEGSEVGLIGG